MNSPNGARAPYEYGSHFGPGPVEERSRTGPRLEDGLRAGLRNLEMFATSNVLRFERSDKPPRRVQRGSV